MEPNLLMDQMVEMTFEGGHRVTIKCSSGAKSFLGLAAANSLKVIAAQDFYEYYDLPEPNQEVV